MIPLMILAALIATVPVLYWTVREHRELYAEAGPVEPITLEVRTGRPDPTQTTDSERIAA